MTPSTDRTSPDRNVELFERARALIPGGVNSPVRAFRAVGGTPRFVQRAQGAYFWDANGQRYTDYIGSWAEVLREDNRAIVRAASQASKAADYLLNFLPEYDQLAVSVDTGEREAA